MDSNENLKKEIKINPKDLYKISTELILNIILKDGSIIILDESIPSQEINLLFNNNNHRNKNISINLNNLDNFNGETLEINENKLNNNTINNFYSQKINKKISSNEKIVFNSQNPQNKSISELVTEKFQKKFQNSVDNSNMPRKVKTSVNSEININIKGNETKKKYSNSLLRDFDELLLNFNDKKKGLYNESINDISKKKYKYYKKLNSRKNDRLFLDDITGVSSNTKAIKYIGKNDSKINSTINTDFNRNSILGNMNLTSKSRLSFLKERNLKKNKSNNFYLLKNERTITDIISPPNHLCYNKISFK